MQWKLATVIDFSVQSVSRHLIRSWSSCSWSLKARVVIQMQEGNVGALWSTLTAWDGGKPLWLNLFSSAWTAESSNRRKHLQPQINSFCSLEGNGPKPDVFTQAELSLKSSGSVSAARLRVFVWGYLLRPSFLNLPPVASAFLKNRQLGKGAQGSPVWRL